MTRFQPSIVGRSVFFSEPAFLTWRVEFGSPLLRMSSGQEGLSVSNLVGARTVRIDAFKNGSSFIPKTSDERSGIVVSKPFNLLLEAT